MSRELKFRAWCPKCSRFETIPLWEKEYLSEEDDFSVWMDDLVIEQYTGLKDKNGREIYEGDIVRATYFEAHYRALKVGKKRKITGKIIYGSACFFIESISDETPLLQVGGSENIEVIGNIHENPELLGGED